MSPCFCSMILPSTSVSNFISHHPHLQLLQNHCTSMKDLQIIHAQLIKTGLIENPLASSRVLAFCTSPYGDMNYAYRLFTRIQNPNLFIWNTIIRGFSVSSTPEIAIALFIEMLLNSPIEPCNLTYPSVFRAYSYLGMACFGAQLHGRVIKLGLKDDSFIRNSVIYMYVNGGFSSEAKRVFYESLEFDIVAFNSMIMGLAKCGEIDESWRLFDKMPQRNTVTWNSMISGYVRSGRFIDALALFREMQEERIEPSEFTMVSVLNACGHLGALTQGQWIHDYIGRKGIVLNVIVTTAIIDMYCRCGDAGKAYEVFCATKKKGLSCWNSMILGLARNGYEKEAILLFSRLECSNLRPDHVSFIGVLTACNHRGLIDSAKEFFLLMTEKYDLEPLIQHYSCMVDMLARAGCLEEAEGLVGSMPMKPDCVIWGSLLFASHEQRNADMAEWAAKQIIELNPLDSSAYVLLSNAYADSCQFVKALEQRVSMNEKQIEKEPGCSLIEVGGDVHEFLAGGRLHPRSNEIYCLLDKLGRIMRNDSKNDKLAPLISSICELEIKRYPPHVNYLVFQDPTFGNNRSNLTSRHNLES